MIFSFCIWDTTSALENSHLLPGFSMFEVLQLLLTVFFGGNEIGEIFLLGGIGDANIHEPPVAFWASIFVLELCCVTFLWNVWGQTFPNID